MNDVLGLIDALEALVVESSKIPMTDKVIIEEKPILQMIDKIRLSVKNGNVARESIDINKEVNIAPAASSPVPAAPQESLSEAKEKAKKIKQGANEYAEYVLSNLQLAVTKLQNQIMKLEKNIENGREVLEHQKEEDNEQNR